MKNTILGFPQGLAVQLGLSIEDLILWSYINDMQMHATEKVTIDGKEYVWVNYKSVLEYLPILGVKKRALGTKLDKLVRLGVLEKYLDLEKGKFTYFRATPIESITPKDSRPNNTGIVAKTAVKYKPLNNKTENKEKDTTKVVSKKKDGVNEFERVFAETTKKMREDDIVAMMLSSYHITDYDALFSEWKRHIIKHFKQDEFVKDGYKNNCRYLSLCMRYLDLGKATGVKLGKGEYLKDGKRYYINPRGVEKEVPYDAPPRQLTSQVWYTDEKKWGPML